MKIWPCDQAFPWRARKNLGRFQNLCTNHFPRWRDVARWKLGLGPREIFTAPTHSSPLSISALNLDRIHHADRDRITATWLGHSTFLLQMGGRNYLTDPIFSPYCSPVPLRCFRRRFEEIISLNVLPRINAVFLSHNHFDHLDRPSLERLGFGVKIHCPMGAGAQLRRWGFTRVRELSWGDFTKEGDVGITCVPTQHGSGRSLFDRNRSLWCGWLLRHNDLKTIFLGDTGYAPFFRDLGDYFKSVDLALIPIGAYRPACFMKPLHLSPVEAVQVHRDLRARCSVAMHWGTFQLADDSMDEAADLLRDALAMNEVPEKEFRIMRIHETIVL